MKTTVKIVLVIAAVALCSNVSAQSQKLAHINMQELISLMPESDSAQVKLQKIAKAYDDEIEQMRVDLNKKYADYIENRDKLTDLVRNSREQEIQSMQQRMQIYQESMQESYQQEYQKLLQPVQEKAIKAIETVAKEQNVSYVLDSQVLHFKAVGTIDLLPAVKDYLKIKK